jgi:hypothetical protein
MSGPSLPGQQSATCNRLKRKGVASCPEEYLPSDRRKMLTGDHDRLNRPKVIELAKRVIPQIEAEIIPNAGHMLSMEQPEFVDGRILRFFAKDNHRIETGDAGGSL